MAECLTPLKLKNKITGDYNVVPCSKCPNCKARRASGWSFRLMQEGKNSISSHFITLSYDTQHVPITNSAYMSLSKRDLQLFFKRLRKHPLNRGRSIKYYAVGEYGSKTFRPHYHLILFNADIRTISDSWLQGNIHFGTVCGASIGYTLKYLCKPSRIPLHKNDDRVPEFSLMSKRLGTSYLTNGITNYHKADPLNRVCLTTEQGHKLAMPRYYKDKIFSEAERNKIKFHYKFNPPNREEQSEWDRVEATLAAFRRAASAVGKLDKI